MKCWRGLLQHSVHAKREQPKSQVKRHGLFPRASRPSRNLSPPSHLASCLLQDRAYCPGGCWVPALALCAAAQRPHPRQRQGRAGLQPAGTDASAEQEPHLAHARGGSSEFKGFSVNYLRIHLPANPFISEFQTVYYVEILKILSLGLLA